MKTSSSKAKKTEATKRISVSRAAKSISTNRQERPEKPKVKQEHKRVLTAEGWKKRLLNKRHVEA